jgi:hypothetical protein
MALNITCSGNQASNSSIKIVAAFASSSLNQQPNFPHQLKDIPMLNELT